MAIDWAARWRDAGPYLRAVSIYLCSRLIVLLAIDVGSTYLPLWRGATWQLGLPWYDHLLRWDSEWYAGIVEHGYSYNGDPNDLQPVVFYPLYPMLARALELVHPVTGKKMTFEADLFEDRPGPATDPGRRPSGPDARANGARPIRRHHGLA